MARSANNLSRLAERGAIITSVTRRDLTSVGLAALLTAALLALLLLSPWHLTQAQSTSQVRAFLPSVFVQSPPELTVECDAYPFEFFYADYLAVAGVINNRGSAAASAPQVTVRWLDENGMELASWTGAVASSLLPVGGQIGFPLQGSARKVPPFWTAVQCEAQGAATLEAGYQLMTTNVKAVGSGIRTVMGEVRNLTDVPTGNWAVVALLRDATGRVIASQLEQRTDPIPAKGSATFAVMLDRDVGSAFSKVEAYASDGAVPPPRRAQSPRQPLPARQPSRPPQPAPLFLPAAGSRCQPSPL